MVKVGLNVGPDTHIQGGIEGCTYPITLRSSDSERKRHREQLWRLYQKGSFIVEICTLLKPASTAQSSRDEGGNIQWKAKTNSPRYA